jgi:hypothetical protein
VDAMLDKRAKDEIVNANKSYARSLQNEMNLQKRHHSLMVQDEEEARKAMQHLSRIAEDI